MIKNILILFMLLTLVGCFNISTELNVNSDGSGTIKQKMLFSQQMRQMVESISKMGNSDSTQTMNSDAPLLEFDEEELKNRASNYGEDVEFVSGEPIENEKWSGFEVTYKFEDIDKLSISGDPSDFTGKTGPMNNDSEEEKDKGKIYRFAFNEVLGASELKIVTTESLQKENFEDSNEENEELIEENPFESMDPSQLEMAKSFMGDMHFLLKINFNDNIKSTNATFREGDSIILTELDFNELIENSSELAKMKNSNIKTKKELIEAIKKVKGIKMEIQDEINVRF